MFAMTRAKVKSLVSGARRAPPPPPNDGPSGTDDVEESKPPAMRPAGRNNAATGHAIARLTGGVAHDINNLLQTVSGNLELLGDLVEGNPAAEELLRTISATTGRSGHLTHNLMAFCRQQIVSPAWRADLRLVMERIQDLLPRALGSSAQVTFKLPPDPAAVAADPGQIEICLLELGLALFDAWPLAGLAVQVQHCSAAADATDLAPGDYAVVSVANLASVGAPPPILAGIEGELAALVRRAGAVPRLIKTAGGRRVEMWLPMLGARTAAKAAAPEGPLVLLVDDAPDVLITLSAFLEGEGFSVITARNGRDALAALGGRRRVDVVVTDYAMPGMSGIELLEQIREIAPTLPAIIVTGFAVVEKLVAVRDRVEVLRKPFRREYLVTRVRALANPAPEPPRENAFAGSAAATRQG